MHFQLFSGNTDSHTVKVSYLEQPVTARFLRLHVQSWHKHPSLRMEIIGCQGKSSDLIILINVVVIIECNKIISEVPFTLLEASSHKKRKKRNACAVADGHIHSNSGWCPRRSNGKENL